MKFGGTSVGDAESLRRATGIIAGDAREGRVVAVVSAMAGVTDQLIAAAQESAAGETRAANALAEALRRRHVAAAGGLLADVEARARLAAEIDWIIAEAAGLCREAAAARALAPRARDAVLGAGERLSAVLLAEALGAAGQRSVAVEATQVIVTTGEHGRAEPLAAETRERAAARLAPLLAEGVIPVVTGFIGATAEGVLTTLGRGGSDYSATILAAALGADEVVIWTDVDGVLTADPRLVPEAATLPDLSYEEAAALAAGGAKVLHPQTLRPVAGLGIPVWIRNSFAPGRPGTLITGAARHGVKSLAARDAAESGAAVVTVVGERLRHHPDVARRISWALAGERIPVLALPPPEADNQFSLTVPRGELRRALVAVHRALDLGVRKTLLPEGQGIDVLTACRAGSGL